MTETPPGFDFLAKILFLGELGTGKTTFWYRYCEGILIPTYCITPGVDFRLKRVVLDGEKVKMQIWDTSSQERFGPLRHFYYRNVHGIILCYGINSRKSFERVEYWLEEVKKYATEKDICILLVGTKCDLYDERVVSTDEGEKLAESLGIKFIEVSAKENLNLDEVFLTLAGDIKEVLTKKNSNGLPATQLHSQKNNPQTNCFNCS